MHLLPGIIITPTTTAGIAPLKARAKGAIIRKEARITIKAREGTKNTTNTEAIAGIKILHITNKTTIKKISNNTKMNISQERVSIANSPTNCPKGQAQLI